MRTTLPEVVGCEPHPRFLMRQEASYVTLLSALLDVAVFAISFLRWVDVIHAA